MFDGIAPIKSYHDASHKDDVGRGFLRYLQENLPVGRTGKPHQQPRVPGSLFVCVASF